MAVGNHSKVIPPLVSAPRITTLVASLLVALSAGTNYVYSAYAPQLGARLGISHTQLNVVGLAGNIGVYTSGPLWGRIVDKRGPRILLASGFVLLLGGYSGMRYLYNTGLPSGVESISFLGLCVLVLFGFMTGTGGNAGFMSAVNSTAKTFPDKARATATGVVISGFGLSAFFFSTISHMFFAGNTSAFFLVLALGTSFPMIMGFFLVRPIPLPEAEGYDEIDNVPDEVAATSALDRDATHTPLLDEDEDANEEEEFRRRHENLNSDSDLENARVEGVELDSSAQRLALRNRSLSRGAAMALDVAPNLHGLKLVLSGDFLLLFTILSIVSGTGLMYINNVGSMSQALYAHQHPVYDEKEAAGWQATQVSTISLMNFSGRIFIGLVSDFAKNKYDIPRSYCLVLVTFMIFASQVLTAMEDRIENLWVASSILGLAYGSAFSLFPNVCLEWFGMPHFSENWGYLSLSPMVAGNIFSVIFGQNLDAHDGSKKSLASAVAVQASRSATSLAPQCLQGLECYVDTIYLTIGADFVAIILSVWAGLRDRRKIAIARRAKYVRRPASAWEAT